MRVGDTFRRPLLYRAALCGRSFGTVHCGTPVVVSQSTSMLEYFTRTALGPSDAPEFQLFGRLFSQLSNASLQIGLLQLRNRFASIRRRL